MPDEQDQFDPREYLTQQDWHAVLRERGWEAAPQGIHSVKKTYRFPKGWFITVWVEKDESKEPFLPVGQLPPGWQEAETKIVAYGPHGNALGGLWASDDDALNVVAQIDRIIKDNRLDYKAAANAIGRALGNAQDVVEAKRPAAIVNALLEGDEDFSAAEYMRDDYSTLMARLGYQAAGARAFSKAVEGPQAELKIYWDGMGVGGDHGYFLVEGRNRDWPQYARWEPQGNPNFHTLIEHSFEADPPFDVVTEVDAALSNWQGTVDEAEVWLTHLKSRLLDLTNRVWQAKKRRHESVPPADDFDPKDYLMAQPPLDIAEDELAEAGWTLEDRETGWGWKWHKNEQINNVLCILKLFIHPEFPHEAFVEVQANYEDDRGFEWWDTIEQDDHGWWEMNQGESITDYVARILDGMSRLEVPEFPETPEPDYDDQDE